MSRRGQRSRGGLLTAVGKGEARVMAVNENAGDWMSFKILH
jgi:hypothetical protein